MMVLVLGIPTVRRCTEWSSATLKTVVSKSLPVFDYPPQREYTTLRQLSWGMDLKQVLSLTADTVLQEHTHLPSVDT